MPEIGFKLPGAKKTCVPDSPCDGQVLTFNSCKDLWDAQCPTGGQDNTSSNAGCGDGWALAKCGVDLPFKSLITTSPVATSVNANDLTITLNALVNADISACAAIVYSKLLFSNNIVAGDIAPNAIDTSEIADNAVDLAQMAGGIDGNLITYDSCGNPVAVATGNCGQVLTSNGAGAAPTFQAGGGGGCGLFAAKTKNADESRCTCTTLANDDTLTFCVSANKMYYVEMNIFARGNETADMKVAVSVPTNATVFKGPDNTIYYRDVSTYNNTCDFSCPAIFNQCSVNTRVANFVYLVDTGACTGTVAFQWAQNISNAGCTTVKAGSSIRVVES